MAPRPEDHLIRDILDTEPGLELVDHTTEHVVAGLDNINSDQLIRDFENLVNDLRESIDELEVQNEAQRLRIEYLRKVARDRERTIAVLLGQIRHERARAAHYNAVALAAEERTAPPPQH